MMKKVLLASVFSIVFASAAFAKAPADKAECNTMVREIFMSLAKKQMSEDATKKAENMLDTLVDQCGASKFAEADETASELKAL